jgi:spermidine synthase
MSRNAFLLGYFATGSQVLLLRELVSSLNGSEFFIGTALFGWLIWVALGAYFGGHERSHLSTEALFAVGLAALPVSLILTRVAPLVVTDVVGELIPFSTAALISILVVLPTGLTAGWLFPVITRESKAAKGAVITVYLWEGLGAFAAGLITALLVGGVVSSLGMSFLIMAVVLVGVFTLGATTVQRRIVAVGFVLAALSAGFGIAPTLDAGIDAFKYRSYRVVTTFDTHYSHQTILTRDSTVVLLTDNTIEAVHPDIETSENMLIPPLIYQPEAKRILYVGRAEFGVAQLVERFPSLRITSVDPRESLDSPIDNIFGQFPGLTRVATDPVKFCQSGQSTRPFDIIVLAPRELSSYQATRLVSDEFIRRLKLMMTSAGILFIPTTYDSDRYITKEEARLLSTIHEVLRTSFSQVAVWPGNMTLFFASDSSDFNIPYDSIVARIGRLPYQAQYVSSNYLSDRLNSFKRERLENILELSGTTNSLERPILPYYQSRYQAKAHAFDRFIFAAILARPGWIWAVGLAIIAFVIGTAITDRTRNSFPLALYFVAGLVSLTLELVAFYLYQSSAGSLYSELAALIGAFMLGLAAGTYLTHKFAGVGAEILALALLLVASVLFLATFEHVPPEALPAYYALFLFTVAVGTGSLFVAVTARYFRTWPRQNRGVGYAWELFGSAIGAILPTTILLPVIGVTRLLTAVIALLALALVGCVATARWK